MASEIEKLNLILADSASTQIEIKAEYEALRHEVKQDAIKTDLEISHLKMKNRLLEETLDNK